MQLTREETKCRALVGALQHQANILKLYCYPAFSTLQFLGFPQTLTLLDLLLYVIRLVGLLRHCDLFQGSLDY